MNPQNRGKLEEQLSAYLDGSLSADQRVEVEAFLAEDEQARGLLEELQRTAELLRSLPRAKAGEELIDALRGRLERKALLGDAMMPAETSRPIRSSAARWVAVAAVLALSLTALYTIWSSAPNGWPRQPSNPQYALQDQAVSVPVESVVDADEGMTEYTAVSSLDEGLSDVAYDAEPPALLVPSQDYDQSMAIGLDPDVDQPIASEAAEPAAILSDAALPDAPKIDEIVIELAFSDRPSLDRAIAELSSEYGLQRRVAKAPRFAEEEVQPTDTPEKSVADRYRDSSMSVVTMSADLPDREVMNGLIDRMQTTRQRVGDPWEIRIEETPPASPTLEEQQIRGMVTDFLSRLQSSLADHLSVEVDEAPTDTQPESPIVAHDGTHQPLPSVARSARGYVGTPHFSRELSILPDPVANQPVGLDVAESLPALMDPPVATAPATMPAVPSHILRLYLRVPVPLTPPVETP
ncbi:MAG: hypothetical protein GXY44_07860 [Phycisphaerales bacterium]|nr:hypothetical protein [Phycisphaerales bacterium]